MRSASFLSRAPKTMWTRTRLVRHADSRVLDTTMNQRRYTYNKDLLWILDHLSQYGKILKLKLGFSGRRNVRMSSRDSDFLNALKGVKTDKLDIGCPRHEESSRFDVRFSHSKFSLSMRTFCRVGSLVQSMLSPKSSTENTLYQTRSAG